MTSIGKRWIPSCRVSSCYNNKQNKKNKQQSQMIHIFHKIPSSIRSETRRNWLTNMNITEEFLATLKTKVHVVCDRHFCSNDYATSGSFLFLNAVPSLHLEEVIEYSDIVSSFYTF